MPGELHGLEAMWKRFGSRTLPWAQLVQPAADLARSGFAAHPYLVYIMSGSSNLTRMKVGYGETKAGVGVCLAASALY